MSWIPESSASETTIQGSSLAVVTWSSQEVKTTRFLSCSYPWYCWDLFWTRLCLIYCCFRGDLCSHVGGWRRTRAVWWRGGGQVRPAHTGVVFDLSRKVGQVVISERHIYRFVCDVIQGVCPFKYDIIRVSFCVISHTMSVHDVAAVMPKH